MARLYNYIIVSTQILELVAIQKPIKTPWNNIVTIAAKMTVEFQL